MSFILDGELLALDEFRDDELVTEEELDRQIADESSAKCSSKDFQLLTNRVESSYTQGHKPPPVATGNGLNAVRQMKLTVTEKATGE